MKRILLSLLVLLMVFTALFAVASPVSAIADPDTPPAVNAVYVWEDCLEDGDVGVLIDYFLDYAVLPTDTAQDAYMAVFVDSDGITQLLTEAPYVYNDSGYGRGVIWIYFTPAEVVTYGLTSADVALYRIWLMGNPTVPSGWAGVPPKTISTIDSWTTTGDSSVLIGLRVLYYADVLELLWSIDMIEETAIGSRLTAAGASYFTNVIPSLRTIAPDVFSDIESDPNYIPIDYDTEFGATVTSGTATVAGSPVTLVDGANVIDTGVTTGTVIFDLAGWTFGTVTNLTGTVTGSPADISPGTTTLTVTGAGTFTVNVGVQNTVTLLEDSVTGTGFDLTDAGAAFGMSRWMFSGLIWMLITVIVCGAVYLKGREPGSYGLESGATKVVMVVFTVMVIGGSLLGLLHPLISALLFIAAGALIGYVFFFKSETLHKGFMFMIWVWLIVCIAGNVVAGSNAVVATRLLADVPVGAVSEITVASTEGFPDSGIIIIGDERIGYPSKTATTFEDTQIAGVTTNPILRGMNDTDDVAHATGAMVRTVEAGILNSSLDYKIARIADTAGVVGLLTLPVKLLDLVMTFMVLPVSFLGTDLAILTYIWAVVAAGMIFGIAMQLVGGRRV